MVVMAHGLSAVLKRGVNAIGCKSEGKTGIGSRRIFPPHFKLQVLDSYRNDADCKGNQRATARKYGIHRRQIQKWLQAENNLRNSVGKGGKTVAECVNNSVERKCGIALTLRSVGHSRQRDDSGADAYSQSGSDARVPALNATPAAYSESDWTQAPLVPLDFTTHSRTDPPTPPAACPIDLSLKRAAPAPPTPPVQHTHTPPPLQQQQPAYKQDHDVWDLSTKSTHKRKQTSTATNKPPKLFKPYLDDLQDTSRSSEDTQIKIEQVSADLIKKEFCTDFNYNTHFNNNNCEYTYTLHELQPKTQTINYYYHHPSTANNINKAGYNMLYECEQSPHYCLYDDNMLLHATPLKQRQSYSLDFKLRAIECYYQDDMCRGNQRAVATKYNIHRRQVQKWLKQEEELKQRNESVKQIQNVI